MIHWQTGEISYPAQEPAPGKRWSLLSAGDWAALGGFAEEMLRNPTAPYGPLLPLIRQADLAVVNLETVLSERGVPIPKDGPNLRGPAAAIHALVAAGFRAATLANNHVRDYGREALADTLALCHAHGIGTFGAGLSEAEAWTPLYLEVKGTRVALLALAEHEEAACWPGMDAGAAAWDVARMVELIRSARTQAEVVICQCHVGTEFNPLPAPRLREAFHRFIDAGASLVIGHHPHVPLGLEEYGGGLIAYSLGNFMFDFSATPTPPQVREGYLLGAEFRGGTLTGGQIYPYRAVEGRRLDWLQGEQGTALLAHLERISRPLNDATLLREYWEAFCDLLFPLRWGRALPEFIAALEDSTGERFNPAQRIHKLAQMRNMLRCEAHWDTLQTALDRLVEGRAGTSRPEVIAEVQALNPWLGVRTEPGPADGAPYAG